MLSRRTFLRVSGLTLGAVATVRSLAAQNAGSHALFTNPENTFLATHDMLTEAAFTRQVGSVFHVVLADGSRVPMRLTEVSALAKPVASAPAAAAFLRSTDSLRTVPVRTSGVLRLPGAFSTQRAAEAGLQRGFRVTFRIEGSALPQGSYVVESGVYGPGVMFLVPGGNDPVHTCSAVFVKSGSL